MPRRIIAPPSGPPPRRVKAVNEWDRLRILVTHLIESGVAYAERGGGDPADTDWIEASYKMDLANVERQIYKLQRQFDPTDAQRRETGE